MMSNLMHAAVAHRVGAPLTLEQRPIPCPEAGQVLVKLRASGICHTDLHAVDGDWPVKPTLPFVPGHEGTGVVVACGAGVRDIREGDAVGIAWLHDACGSCEYCGTGWETLCETQHNTGYGVDGTFAEYAIGAANYVARLPAGCDFAEMAPILCAGVTTYKGVRETDTRPGEWIAISGVGGLGHLAIQYAKATGLHVVALDVTDEKLALARECGADATVRADAADAIEQVRTISGGGAHGVLVTAVSRTAFAQSIALARRRGTVSFVGLPPGEFATPIFDVVLKRITLRGSIVGTRRDLAEAINFAAEGKVRARIQRVRLDQVNDVFAQLRAGTLRARSVIVFDS